MVRKQRTKAWYQTPLLPLDGIRKEIEIQCAHFLLSDRIIIFTNTEKRAATYQSSLNFCMSVLKCFENWGTQHQSHYFHPKSCGKWRLCFLYLRKLLVYRLKKQTNKHVKRLHKIINFGFQHCIKSCGSSLREGVIILKWYGFFSYNVTSRVNRDLSTEHFKCSSGNRAE